MMSLLSRFSAAGQWFPLKSGACFPPINQVGGRRFGGVPEWLKGTDCKSVGVRLRWFESSPLHQSGGETRVMGFVVGEWV